MTLYTSAQKVIVSTVGKPNTKMVYVYFSVLNHISKSKTKTGKYIVIFTIFNYNYMS